jgi:hypothetical protein
MLRPLYRQIKSIFNRIIQQVINRSYWIAENAEGIQIPIFRQALKDMAKTIGNIGHFLLQFPRMDAVMVTGDIGSVVYVGDSDTYKLSLLKALFGDDYKEESLGRIAMWKLATYNNEWLKGNDIIIIRVTRFFPWRIRAPYYVENPLRVYQMISLDKPPEDMLAGKRNKNLREAVNRLRKVNITTRISHSMDDLRFFYDNMYVPTMHSRHADRTVITPYQTAERQYKNGYLWFLSLDGHEVAGSLCYVSADNNIFTGSFLGYLDGNTQFLKQDLGTALYWYSMQQAREKGVKMINLLESVAWVSNGVYNYKQKWGAKPHTDPYNHEKILLSTNQLSDEWRLRLNNIGFLASKQEKYMRVYFDEPESSMDGLLEDARTHGLDGVQFVTRDSRKDFL